MCIRDRPEDIEMERIEIDQVRGGDAKRNAEILLSVLKNEASPFLEVTVLNACLLYTSLFGKAWEMGSFHFMRRRLACGSFELEPAICLE